MNPFFSIIIVCYNAGEELHKTLASILAQSFADFEIILKDGKSTDGSLSGLPGDDRVRLFCRADEGIYDAMNQAVDEIKGNYVLFLNCGDYFYDKEVLAQIAELINADRSGRGANEQCIYYGDTYERKTGNVVMSNPHLDAFGCYRNVPCHQSCFYASQLLRAQDLQPGRACAYDTSYPVRADYEHFLWCFFQKKAPAVYLPVTICSYEGGGFSETKENRKRAAKEHRLITGMYLSRWERMRFRLILLLTLAPLRSRLSRSKRFSAWYQRVKKRVYER